MGFTGQACLVLLAVVAAAAYWSWFEPLPDSWDQLSPQTIHNGRYRRMISRWSVLLESLGVTTFAKSSRFVQDYYTSKRNYDNTSEISTYNTNFDGLPVRIYLPTSRKENGPGMLYIHGGGNVFGSIDSYDHVCRQIAIELGIVVASVAYRLAPEDPFPASLDDAEIAVRYFAKNAKKFGVDASRLVVGGDSAGGYLTVGVNLRLKNKPLNVEGAKIATQVLIYPFVQAANFSTASWIANAPDPILARDLALRYILMTAIGARYFEPTLREKGLQAMRFNCLRSIPKFAEKIKKATDDGRLFSKVASNGHLAKLRAAQQTDGEACPYSGAELEELGELLGHMLTVDFSPLFAPSYEGLPPALIISAENDVIRDDSFLVGERLKQAGVLVEHAHFMDMYHGFLNVEGLEAIRRIKTFLTEKVKIL